LHLATTDPQLYRHQARLLVKPQKIKVSKLSFCHYNCPSSAKEHESPTLLNLENPKMTTPRTISASELRDQIRTVINEVCYGQAEYLVIKFGQPAAVIISPADFQLLQQARQQLDPIGQPQSK
jgi:prevent-host-death family protein